MWTIMGAILEGRYIVGVIGVGESNDGSLGFA